MPVTKAWDWSKNTDGRWLSPCIESGYLAERWSSQGFEKFLDLGCGLGRHAVYMGMHGFDVTAVELSPEAVRRTGAWAAGEHLNVKTLVTDMLSLPFADDSFDCILSYNVIYHTDTIGFQAALAEIRRVLRPGGELFLTLISKDTWSYRQADPSRKMDEHTILRNEEETEADVPHFFVDLSDIRRFFADFEFVRPPVEEREYSMEDSCRCSTHWKLLVKNTK